MYICGGDAKIATHTKSLDRSTSEHVSHSGGPIRKIEIYYKHTKDFQKMKLSEKVQVYDDTYPMKHIRKTTDTFRSLNFRCHKTHHYKLKVVVQVE